MKYWDALIGAISAIRGNALRSGLTMLGVIIGVAAVIIVVAIGAGAREVVVDQIRSLGTNLIMIDARGSLWLSASDAAAIEQNVPGVRVAVPVVRTGKPVVRGSLIFWTSLNGTGPGFTEARDWSLLSGRNFTEDEAASGAKVVLLGTTISHLLFGTADPVGEIVNVNNVPLTVIGLLSPKGQSNTGRDQDDIAIIPLKTLKTRIEGVNPVNPDRIEQILVKVSETADMKQAEKDIMTVLRERPKLAAVLNEDISVKNLADVLKIKEASASALALLVAAIASISLIVGGIGIMNIMLVSVIERTREIGIRMAVGARRRDILIQFLIEAVTLSGIGGLIGLFLGVVGSGLIALFAQWPFIISVHSLALAVGFSVATGVLFGFYPARRASLLNPIEALRHE